jgi:hypothetical protein
MASDGPDLAIAFSLSDLAKEQLDPLSRYG